MTRRDFVKGASILGAALAFSRGDARRSTREWRERRDLYPEGAWWEYQPARVKKPSGPSLETFDPTHVTDAPITEFDTAPDGGPLQYRVSHRASLWKRGERPKLDQRVLEAAPNLSM